MTDLDYIGSLGSRNDIIKCLIDYKHITPTYFSIPSRLYKYSRLDNYILESLEKSEITLSNPSLFNDIYDSVIHNDMIRYHKSNYSYLDSLYSTPDQKIILSKLKDKRKELDYLFGFNFRDFLRISCFSTSSLNTKSWGIYSDNGRGICIEYDLNESKNQIYKYLFPIIYLDSPIDVSSLCETNTRLAVLLSSLIKSKEWEYENEWRLVFIFSAKTIQDRIKISCVPFPKSVYIGSKVDIEKRDEKIEKLLYFCKKNKIKIFRVDCSLNSFQLGFKEIII